VPRVLILQHVPYEGQGYIADHLRGRDIPFHVARMWERQALPNLAEYSALIVMGGPMAVYEDFPWRDDVVALLRAAVGRIRVLGICLGAQLLAHALGAKVYPNVRDGQPAKEVGYYTVRLTREGAAHPLFKGFAPDVKVFEWHGDAFDLPNGATLLATSPLCEHQAFARGNAYGIMFHLEFTPEMIEGIALENRTWAHQHFDLDEAALVRDARANASLMRAQCGQLIDNFLA
jgi:GMP synthase-like glutamine amidotransferase